MYFPQFRLTGTGYKKRIGMAGAGEGQAAIAAVEEYVHHGDERRFRKRLGDHVAVELLQHLVGRQQTILLAGNLLGLDRLLEKDRQQAGGYAMAHDVGDIEANVVLVEAEDVIEVAADPATGSIMDRKPRRRQVGQALWQHALLNAAGQVQLLVDVLIRRLPARGDTVEFGGPGSQPVVKNFEAQERLHLGQQLGRGERANQASVGAVFKTRQTQRRVCIWSNVE